MHNHEHQHDFKEVEQTTNSSHTTSFWGVWLFLIITALLGIWVMQQSINAYFVQTYHKPSPIADIQNPLWLKGGEIGKGLYAASDKISQGIADGNAHMVAFFNDNFAYTPEFKVEVDKQKAIEAERLAKENAIRQAQIAADQKQAMMAQALTINSSQKVFFAGDSMMQGIAPHMQKYLQGLGIQSVNLSKQSTGLSYPKFFDWQSTIKDTISKDPSIKVLIVMLGPNDPWDMPASGGRYLKFKTPEWDAEYQSRMADIINFATARNVGVIWVTPPNMRKTQLNEQMIHLNKVMSQELDRHQVLAIDSRPIMGGKDDVYSDYLNHEGKQVKMRSGDGIHFTVDGQKILAKQVQSHLIIQ